MPCSVSRTIFEFAVASITSDSVFDDAGEIFPSTEDSVSTRDIADRLLHLDIRHSVRYLQPRELDALVSLDFKASCWISCSGLFMYSSVESAAHFNEMTTKRSGVVNIGTIQIIRRFIQ